MDDNSESALYEMLTKKNIELKAALMTSEELRIKHQQFLENQQHDIITPLAGIVAFAEALKEEKEIDAIREYAGYISESGQQMYDYNSSLLRDLEWVKGKGRVISLRFDFAETITAAFNMNLATAKAKGLCYSLEMDETIPQYLISDRLHLFQALLNMLSNAVHFTEKGQVVLSVMMLALDDKTATVRFTVTDTGIGIPEENQRYIFDEFYKVQASNASDVDCGRGLGLTLTQKYVAAMGGELYLEYSELEKGSEFRMTIPFEVALDQCD